MFKVTQLKATKNGERVNVYLDGQYSFTLEQSTLISAMLYQGKELTPEEIEKYKRQDTYAFLYRRLLQYAMIRPRSQLELKRKAQEMIDKGSGSGSGGREGAKIGDGRLKIEEGRLEKLDVIESVLEQLAAQGFTDESFARWWVEQRMAQGKYGIQKVKSELAAQKVDRSIIAQAVAPYVDDMQTKKQTVLQKKFGVSSLDEIKDLKEKAKAYRFLASRGF